MSARYSPRLLPYLAGAIALVLLLAGITIIGARMGGDSARYTEGGSAMVSSLAAGHPEQVPPVYWIYTVPMLLIGAGHLLLGASLPLTFVILNCVLFSGIVALQFHIWNRIVRVRSLSAATAVFALVAGLGLMMGLPYVPLWNYFVLSEILFLAVVAWLWYAMVDAVLTNDRSRWNRAGLIAAAAVPVRPEGPLVAGFWLGARLHAQATGTSRRLIEVGMFLVPALIALAIFPAFAYAKTQGADLPWFLAPDLLVGYFRNGVVVLERHETYLASPQSYLDFVWISLVRLAYFFLPVYSSYSFAHKVVSTTWSFFAAAFVIAGFRYLRRAGGEHVTLALLTVWFAWILGLMRTIFVVDYDWRFQLPPLVGAWIVGGCGILSICKTGEATVIDADLHPSGV
jgi:hypothetical protein